MAGIYRNSPLPKEIDIRQSAVPVFTSVGDSAMRATTTLTDLTALAITNTTGAAVSVTVTDNNDVPIANLSSYAITPSTPYDLQFDTPFRAVSGIKIYAVSAGLKFTMRGWRHPGFTAQ